MLMAQGAVKGSVKFLSYTFLKKLHLMKIFQLFTAPPIETVSLYSLVSFIADNGLTSSTSPDLLSSCEAVFNTSEVAFYYLGTILILHK